jgi:methyl-accepting chemotaxis protein
LQQKILFGFSIVILLTILLSVSITISMNQMNRDFEKTGNELALLIVSEKLAFEMAESINHIRGYLLYDDERYREEFEAGKESIATLEKDLLEMSGSGELEDLLQQKSEWDTLTDEFFTEIESGNEDIIAASGARIAAISDDLINGFQGLAHEQEAEMQELSQSIDESGITLITFAVIISIVVAILGMVIAYITAVSIRNPIRTVMNRMTAIAEGKLDQTPLKRNAKDETGQLVQALNEMQKKLRGLMTNISGLSNTVSSHSAELTQSAGEVSSGAEQVSQTMEELASGAETQSNYAGELALTLSEFAKKMDETNNKGERVQQQSSQVLHMTNEGKDFMNLSMHQMENIDRIVRDTVEKVNNLDAHSREVSELVTVIQDIADQTNLLSFNASIEAAHAGEHGRGFAIVAGEVRKLAEQVDQSVTHISRIVENMQNEVNVVTHSLQNGYEEVEQGTEQIQKTNDQFTNIQDSIAEVARHLRRITENLSESTADSQKVNGAIQEMASVSEQSAAGIEETSASTQQATSSMQEVTASANELSEVAEELDELVRQFKL